MGVLFEISIVCHVLCSWFWRVGWGFSLFLGGLFWLVRRVFSGFWGFLRFSLFCSCLLGWVAGCGGFRGSGSARPGVLLPSCWGGRVWGASARARFLSCPVLAVVGVGGRVRGCARRPVPAVLWWGSGCARFPVRVRGVVVVFAGGFRVLFFPSGASRVFLVLRCLVLCWVVVSAGLGGCGGCRVGFGVVFSPASVVLARACFRFPSWGLVWVWVGFCLESLILAQDERWRRA